MIFEKGILIIQLWETIVLMWLPGQVCSISMQNPRRLTTPNKNSEFVAKSGDGKCCNQHFQIDSFLPLPTNQLVYQDSHGSTFFFRNWISTKSLPKSAIGGLSFFARYLVYTSSLPKVQTRKSGELFWPSEMDQLSKETPLTTSDWHPDWRGLTQQVSTWHPWAPTSQPRILRAARLLFSLSERTRRRGICCKRRKIWSHRRPRWFPWILGFRNCGGIQEKWGWTKNKGFHWAYFTPVVVELESYGLTCNFWLFDAWK